MPFVLDASVTCSWVFDDEQYPAAAEALRRIRNEAAVVPTIWWFEVRNTVIMNERHGRLTETTTAAFLLRLGRLPIVLDHSPDQAALLALARRHRITVYDAAYLELARREAAPLATLDKQLATAAQAEQVELIISTG